MADATARIYCWARERGGVSGKARIQEQNPVPLSFREPPIQWSSGNVGRIRDVDEPSAMSAFAAMIEIFIQVVEGWRELGAVGLGALAVAFIIGAMVFAPRPPMCVVSGLVFGFIAIPVVLLGSTLGSVLAFLLSRYLFRCRFLKMIERRPVWRALVEAIDAEGWRLVALLRLASLIPGTATNYLLGVTRVGLWPYTVATLVGLLPQVFLFVYIAAAGHIALEELSESPLRVALIVIGLIFTAWAVFMVTRRTKVVLAVYWVLHDDFRVPGRVWVARGPTRLTGR
jgi:uncharacterized membrane protein YdjX (TVP38/TMEM64 family)